MKHQRNIKNKENEGFEYLPMCAVLNIRIPANRHYSFIQRVNTGLNSVFSGLNNGFIKKMYQNLEIISK
jgi:hypothetical protein